MQRLRTLVLVLIIIFMAVSPVQGAAFYDINNHWAEQDILKMAAKGLIFGDNKGYFYPEQFVSRRESITLVVRLIGKEDLAVQLQQGESSIPAGSRGIADWARGYIMCAHNDGIITSSELLELDWAAAASREEISVWLSKAIKLLPVVSDIDSILQRFVDGSQIDRLKLPYIIPLVQDNIIVGSNAHFYPGQPLKRAELAALMKRVDDKYLAQRIVRSQEGEIVSIASKPYESLTIRSNSGQFITLAVSGETKIFKNGQKTKTTGLATGDRLEYVTDSAQGLIYAETLGANDSIGNDSGQSSYYNTNNKYNAYGVVEGELVGIDWLNSTLDLVVDGSWQRFKLGYNLLERSGSSYYCGSNEIEIGDNVEITLNNDWIMALRLSSNVNSDEIEIYKATLDNVDTRNEELELESGSVDYWNGTSWRSKSGISSLEMDSDVEIYDYDGDEIDIDDLEDDFEGDIIYMLYDEDEEKVIKVRVKKGSEYTYSDEIEKLNRDSFELENKSKEIYYDDATIVVAGDEFLDVDDLDEGDEVKAVINRYDSKYYAVVVEAEENDSSSNSDDEVVLYKATLDAVDTGDDEIEIKRSSMEYWDGDNWDDESRSLNLEIDSGVDIYDYDGDELDLSDLKDYEEDTVYILYDDEEEEVLQIMVEKSEKRLSLDKIKKIKSSYFELDDEDDYSIYYDDWTVVMEGDELLDIDDIEEDDEVRIVVNRSGSKYYAVLIELDDRAYSSGIGDECTAYWGQLDDVDEEDEEIILEDDSIYRRDDDEWVEVHWNKTLDVGDADIYYNRSEIESDDLESYEGEDVYFVCDAEDDETVIKLCVCRGDVYKYYDEISEISSSNNRLELLNEEIGVYFGNYTILIEDEELIDEDDLSRGDEIYIVVEKIGSKYYALFIQLEE